MVVRIGPRSSSHHRGAQGACCEKLEARRLLSGSAGGGPDPSFGAGGLVSWALPNASSSQNGFVASALAADGKVLLVGNPMGASFSLARFNSTGTIDAGFASGGVL